MPLDTSAYSFALLRIDGRRWNELRRFNAQIRTQDAADGSSYLEIGHTKVMCIVTGPSEPGAGAGGGQGAGGGGAGGGSAADRPGAGGGAAVVANVTVAGFSSVDRKRWGRMDKRKSELEAVIAKTFASTLHTHLYPHSTILISLHVLSQDGSLLAALLNASTLALIDAGIPMQDYVAACTAGSTSTHAAADEGADPLLDLNAQEETELPFTTVATLGAQDKVVAWVCESRVQLGRLEGMLAVGVDGCKQVRHILDRCVKEMGVRMVRDGAVQKGMDLDIDMEL